MNQVAVVGSFNLDLLFTTDVAPKAGETRLGRFVQAPGGKGYNQAVAAARAGADVSFIASIGTDDAAIAAKSLAIDDSIHGVWWDDCDNPTGRAGIFVDGEGENRIIVAPGANRSLPPDYVVSHLEKIAPAVVLVQLEIPPETALAAILTVRAQGGIAILNPAPIPSDNIQPLLDAAHLVTPNESELARLADSDETSWRVNSGSLQVGGDLLVTLGRSGVALIRKGQQPLVAPAFDVSAVDTTGAGDAFNGVLAAGIAEHGTENLLGSIRRAQAAAALSVQKPGAAPSMPTQAQIEAFAIAT